MMLPAAAQKGIVKEGRMTFEISFVVTIAAFRTRSRSPRLLHLPAPVTTLICSGCHPSVNAFPHGAKVAARQISQSRQFFPD
jgi:hypothetical protein